MKTTSGSGTGTVEGLYSADLRRRPDGAAKDRRLANCYRIVESRGKNGTENLVKLITKESARGRSAPGEKGIMTFFVHLT